MARPRGSCVTVAASHGGCLAVPASRGGCARLPRACAFLALDSCLRRCFSVDRSSFARVPHSCSTFPVCVLSAANLLHCTVHRLHHQRAARGDWTPEGAGRGGAAAEVSAVDQQQGRASLQPGSDSRPAASRARPRRVWVAHGEAGLATGAGFVTSAALLRARCIHGRKLRHVQSIQLSFLWTCRYAGRVLEGTGAAEETGGRSHRET